MHILVVCPGPKRVMETKERNLRRGRWAYQLQVNTRFLTEFRLCFGSNIPAHMHIICGKIRSLPVCAKWSFPGNPRSTDFPSLQLAPSPSPSYVLPHQTRTVGNFFSFDTRCVNLIVWCKWWKLQASTKNSKIRLTHRVSSWRSCQQSWFDEGGRKTAKRGCQL